MCLDCLGLSEVERCRGWYVFRGWWQHQLPRISCFFEGCFLNPHPFQQLLPIEGSRAQVRRHWVMQPEVSQDRPRSLLIQFSLFDVCRYFSFHWCPTHVLPSSPSFGPDKACDFQCAIEHAAPFSSQLLPREILHLTRQGTKSPLCCQ